MCVVCSCTHDDACTIKSLNIIKDHSQFDVNATYTLSVKAKPSTASLDDKNVSWQCSDTIVEIEEYKQKCKVRFLSKGKAKITAKVDGVETHTIIKTRSNKQWILFVVMFAALSYFIYKEARLWILKNKKGKSAIKKKKSEIVTDVEKEDSSNVSVNYESKYNKLSIKFKDLKAKYIKLGEDYNNLVDWYELQESEIARLKKQLKARTDKSQDIDIEIKKEKIIKTSANIEKPQNSMTVLYGDFIVDGVINRVTSEPNEDTVFELHVVNDSADILIYNGAKRRILANPAYLDGCEKQIVGDHDVIVAEKGRAQLKMDGQWVIINVLKVIIK